jgi:esterase/lipase superfamily enzyme
MGRTVHCWFYGVWGLPVIVFPSAAGFAHEWDIHGMIDALTPLMARGKIKLYTTESNVSKVLTAKESSFDDRMAHFKAYERYVIEDLVPAVRRNCGSSSIKIATAGTSLGAYYAALFALKYPDIFNYGLCMSGRYELSQFFANQQDIDIYYNSPIAFVSNLGGDALKAVQSGTHLSLVCGRGPWEEGCIEETTILANILEAKAIPVTRDIWGSDSAHSWAWWKKQAVHHLASRFGS